MIILGKLFSWFLGGGWKLFIILVVSGLFLKFLYDFYNDYQNLIEDRQILAENNAKLESANSVNQATILEMNRQFRENEANRQALEISLRNSEDRINDLREILSEHDLEFLSRQKPGLIERRINDATIEVFNGLECITDPNCVQ